jgi:hypothetical protein
MRTYENETNAIRFLGDKISSLNEELNDIILPKHMKLGFISFLVFAASGVLVLLTSKLWGPLVKTNYNLDSDLIALITFGIG